MASDLATSPSGSLGCLVFHDDPRLHGPILFHLWQTIKLQALMESSLKHFSFHYLLNTICP